MSIATEIDMGTVEIACELACEKSAQMASLYDEIGNLRNARAMHLQALFLAIGREMLGKGQKTKRVGGYIIEVGEKIANFCACHGAYLADCDTTGTVIVLPGKPEPYIKVRELRATSKDAAS